jgi:hypothetical protein
MDLLAMIVFDDVMLGSGRWGCSRRVLYGEHQGKAHCGDAINRIFGNWNANMNMAIRTHNVDQKSHEEAIAEIARPQFDRPLSLGKTEPKARACGS